MNIKDIISNVKICGLEESIIASSYPMETTISDINRAVTENDIARAAKLSNTPAGSGHDNWLNGIIVQFDLTFTVKAWTEAERYHFLDFVSSQSTMHKIVSFDLDSSYIEYVDPRIIGIMKEKVEIYNRTKSPEDYLRILYSNPCGFKLTARMTTNYRQLKTIYSQRKNHRLIEWRIFCKWIETLPHSEFVTGGKKQLTYSVSTEN